MCSYVVEFNEIAPAVAQISMVDRTHKNAFSSEIIAGLTSAFARLRSDTSYRAVVLTGYDSYFSSGGTKEGLLELHEGRKVFTEMNIYSLALDCEIPVVSAMQGHGIGGGLALGLFADCVVFSRESIYSANFMKYGFTPGMGSTLILAKKMGVSLAQEMLLTARGYRGSELEQRGLPHVVLPRIDVLEYAHQMARSIAEKPRGALVALKNHITSEIRCQLPTVIEQELRMHKLTIHSPEVRRRIDDTFGI